MPVAFNAAWRNDEGAIALKFAVLVPTFLCVIGGAIDFGIVNDQKSKLQAAADAGSIAAAKELGMSDAKKENIQAIVASVVERYMLTNNVGDKGALTVHAEVHVDPLEVDVQATLKMGPTISSAFGLGVEHLDVRSVARIVGRPNICILGLDPSENGTISLEQNARVTGNDCAVYSNSDHTNSIKSKNSAALTAKLICARGGKSGGPGNFSPEPLTDCPGFDDPLADRPEPVVKPCTEHALVLSEVTVSLNPGVYCGGLHVTEDSKVSLKPGIYIIKDGPLRVDDGASISGDGVGFYFTGNDAYFEFAEESSIDLAAPVEGELAGLLMFESRSQPDTASHSIESDDARRLIGTIYLSRGELRVDAESPIADRSAYTAIIARTMRLYGGPHLILNTNYDQTPVPVPSGVKGTDQPVALVR